MQKFIDRLQYMFHSGQGNVVRPLSTVHRSVLNQLTDMTLPHTWYPFARKKKRRVILHVGPTNSGKTYRALQQLQSSPSGIYCGPLRLLAWEVADKLNKSSVPCSLITGQERKEMQGARHKAMTVEMADLAREYTCAVIDEIQMIGCRTRGSSFTRAILGLAVDELHLCGDPAAISLIKDLISATGDTLEIEHYTRLSPLLPSLHPLKSFSNVKRGDCIVAFSRKEIYAIKRTIEMEGCHKCSVVYGSLPPETRSNQAEQFNDRSSGFDVLVASDAIGMGLNLNIRRIIFTALEKYDGISHRPLDAMQIKQIAGRAGRFKSQYPTGEVTCYLEDDLPYLYEALAVPSSNIQAAGIFPTFDQLALYCSVHPSLSFAHVLEKFLQCAQLSSHYFLCNSESILEIAKLLNDIPMTLEDRYLFCMCPVDKLNQVVMGAMLEFASTYSAKKRVRLRKFLAPATASIPRTLNDLIQLESLHKVLDLYIWLSLRREDAFLDRQLATSQKQLCGFLIEEGLKLVGLKQPKHAFNKSQAFLQKDLKFLLSDEPTTEEQGGSSPHWTL